MYEKQQKRLGCKGQRSPHLNSVQWCEAKAILEVIREIEEDTVANIHTDYKGTVQGLRAVMTKSMGKVKTLKHKDILSQIIEEASKGCKMVVIEWPLRDPDMGCNPFPGLATVFGLVKTILFLRVDQR